MRTVLIIARILVAVAGIGALLLGLLLWSGSPLNLLPIHMPFGGILVLGLWMLVVLGLIARVSWGLVLLTFVWSLIVPALGMMQLRLMPGSFHWVIQLTHLLVGVVAMGLGHMLAARITAAQSAPATHVAAGQL